MIDEVMLELVNVSCQECPGDNVQTCKDEGEDSREEINGCGCCVVLLWVECEQECEQKRIVIKY